MILGKKLKCKLFAAHFDKPRKFYIGPLCDSISRDEITIKLSKFHLNSLVFMVEQDLLESQKPHWKLHQ